MNNKYWLFGTHLSILEESDQTEGRYDLILGKLGAGVETPLHIHQKYSESIYVISGEFTIFMGDKAHVLQPGDHVFIPIGVPHAVACTGSQSGTALTMASPSGFASLIRQVGILGDEGNMPSTLPDMDLFQQLSESIGDVILGPPGSRSVTE